MTHAQQLTARQNDIENYKKQIKELDFSCRLRGWFMDSKDKEIEELKSQLTQKSSLSSAAIDQSK
jgi:hypothetical protein